MAAPSRALDPAFPPARGVQGAPSASRGRAGVTGPVHPGSTSHASQVTGATYRQIDYWIRDLGLLGEDLAAVGSGQRRRFTDGDLEVISSLARLAALGCRDQWMTTAAEALRKRRVEVGEWLMLDLHSNVALRLLSGTAGLATPSGPSWLVPLTPFSEGRPR